jgi:hypothetical protein
LFDFWCLCSIVCFTFQLLNICCKDKQIAETKVERSVAAGSEKSLNTASPGRKQEVKQVEGQAPVAGN